VQVGKERKLWEVKLHGGDIGVHEEKRFCETGSDYDAGSKGRYSGVPLGGKVYGKNTLRSSLYIMHR